MATLSELSARWFRRRPEFLSEIEKRVLRTMIEKRALSSDEASKSEREQFGDRLADGLARIGGSWSFIIGAFVFLGLWTLANVWLLGRDSFDPYPFVFLNLVLSMLAALQAPVIMMSQNRQAERDRREATHDYEVNLKAEIEILALHDKIDDLRQREVARLHEELVRLRDAVERLTASPAHQ